MGASSALEALASATAAPPRLLAVFAHPDDEVLAVGGRLERLSGSRFLCVTDGVPVDGQDARAHGFASLDAYRDGRREELLAAFACAGLDGATCTASLMHQGGTHFISDQTASLHLGELARLVAEEIRRFQPDAILTHPLEGGHPDHDACAFAVHAASRLLGEAPPLLEAPFYHAGPRGIVTGSFLPGGPAAHIVRLSPEQQARKSERLACFVSQRTTLAQFGTETEQYRAAPAYEFTRPPHSGSLFYEGFSWGMSGVHFRQLARTAMLELRL